MRKYPPPGPNVPPIINGLWNPVWYEFLTQRGLLDLPDVDNSTPITNGQVLIYNSTTKKLTPGAN